MIAAAGTATLLTATVLGAVAMGAWIRTARRGAGSAVRVARWSTAGLWLSVAVAVALLEWALLVNDFSVAYVAETGGRDLPLYTRITALWAGAGGSLVLWMLVLATCLAVFARRRREVAAVGAPAHAAATAVLAATFTGFALLTAVWAAPFRRQETVAADGPGPNPLLQDHLAMSLHPPILYVGFAALAVPFALAIGGLALGRVDAAWAQATRRWALVAWIFLTVGIGLGAWWAYGVLGWGGYWAWDPVENVSLMPWLLATALLHIVRSPGRSAGWAAGAVALAGAAFLLVLLGTLLTRSGVVVSVHTFADSPLGVPLLILFATVFAGWTALLIVRRDRLGSARASGDDDPAVLSRQTAIRAQTVLLSMITAVVFLGTVLPVVIQGLTGDRLTVGAPWFNRTAGPLALGLLAVMAIGPLVAWHRDDAHHLLRRLTWPGVVALATTGIVGLAGPGGVYLPVVSGLAAFVATTLVLSDRPRRSRRRTGALIAHTGVALAAVAVVGTSYGSSEQQSLGVGDTLTSGTATATLVGIDRWQEDRRMVAAARVILGDGRAALGTAEPELHFYPSHSMVVADPVTHTGLTRDIQVSLVDVDPEAGTASFRLTATPMMAWLWAAVGLTALGGVVAAIPPRPNRRRPAMSASDRRPTRPAPIRETAGAAREESAGAAP